eukprot:4753414-Pleurochrysis_carterae.AAC.3
MERDEGGPLPSTIASSCNTSVCVWLPTLAVNWTKPTSHAPTRSAESCPQRMQSCARDVWRHRPLARHVASRHTPKCAGPTSSLARCVSAVPLVEPRHTRR